MTRARIAILTCSDTRDPRTDASGRRARELLTEAGHDVIGADIVADDAARIAEAVRARCDDGALDLLVLTGGTGLAPRDVTIEAVAPLLDKELPGFGEAFRRLSWDQVGARSVLSRAMAGSRGETLVVALPGSTKAVELAVAEVLLPFLAHAVDILHGRSAHAPAGPGEVGAPSGGRGC